MAEAPDRHQHGIGRRQLWSTPTWVASPHAMKTSDTRTQICLYCYWTLSPRTLQLIKILFSTIPSFFAFCFPCDFCQVLVGPKNSARQWLSLFPQNPMGPPPHTAASPLPTTTRASIFSTLSFIYLSINWVGFYLDQQLLFILRSMWSSFSIFVILGF